MISRFLSTLQYRTILKFQLLAAAAALGTAFIAQYGFRLHPCELCLAQRYPYGAIIGIAGLALWRVTQTRLQLWLIIFCVLLFALDAGIAFYHTGVELDIFKGPDACSNSSNGEQTLEEMRAAIMNAPLVSCKQAMAYIFGLSMAAWNGLFASGAILLSILGCNYVRRTSR